VDLLPTPLFEFGYGLSYTEFDYSNLQMEASSIPIGKTLKVSCQVKNIGRSSGQEVVQLYLRDLIASVATPVKELKGFVKVSLAPQETKTVSFQLQPEDMSILNGNLQRTIEPGEFELMIGSSSEKIHLREKYTVH
jgi:beta-glucosidase